MLEYEIRKALSRILTLGVNIVRYRLSEITKLEADAEYINPRPLLDS